MNLSEKFKPGVLIKPKEDRLHNTLETQQAVFETGRVLYKTHETALGKIWVADGYRYTLEDEHKGSDWKNFLHRVEPNDVYMILKAPAFCMIPKYFRRTYAELEKKHPICFLNMMVSYGQNNWEIPIVVSEASSLSRKLMYEKELGVLFSDPDIWYSQIFEPVG